MACAEEEHSYSDHKDRLKELQDYRSFLISQRDEHIQHSGIIQEQINAAQNSTVQHCSSLHEHWKLFNEKIEEVASIIEDVNGRIEWINEEIVRKILDHTGQQGSADMDCCPVCLEEYNEDDKSLPP